MADRPFTFRSGDRELRGTLALPVGHVAKPAPAPRGAGFEPAMPSVAQVARPAERAGGASGRAVGLPPCVLLLHGFGSHDDDTGAYARLADRLAAAGIASLRFSFSGSKPYANHGTIRPASEWVFDAIAALRAVEQTGEVDADHLGLLGLSTGGGVVVQVGALCPQVRCVLALSPVADGYQWLRHRWITVHGEAAWEAFVARAAADARRVAVGEPSEVVEHGYVQAMPDMAVWNATLERYPGLLREMALASVADTFLFRPLTYVAELAPRPFLVVHGDADESVPLTQAYDYFGRAGAGRGIRIIPGAPHCCWDTPFEGPLLDLCVEWLQEHL